MTLRVKLSYRAEVLPNTVENRPLVLAGVRLRFVALSVRLRSFRRPFTLRTPANFGPTIEDEMDPHFHWENVYAGKAPTQMSWHSPHLETSLAFIKRVAPDPRMRILDVGGGASTLPDDLLADGYQNLSVLDISERALDTTKARLGARARRVHWIVADVTAVQLPPRSFDVWHDRAVFHFLTKPEERRRYVDRVARSVRIGGHVIIGTFGPSGPSQCSGLSVVRYDGHSLHGEFGLRFRLLDSLQELHRTPGGATQQFQYCLCCIG